MSTSNRTCSESETRSGVAKEIVGIMGVCIQRCGYYTLCFSRAASIVGMLIKLYFTS